MTHVSVCLSQSKLRSVDPPPSFCRGGWVFNQILKMGGGGLTGPQLLEGGCWERGGWIFSGGVQLSHNKLKSEIFNDKKSL